MDPAEGPVSSPHLPHPHSHIPHPHHTHHHHLPSLLPSHHPIWWQSRPTRFGAPRQKPFSHGNNQIPLGSEVGLSPSSLSPIASPPGSAMSGTGLAMDPLRVRVSQLEQSLRFVQEQHRLMLHCLHQEVERLQVRNRDLQFQVIMAESDDGREKKTGSTSTPEVGGVEAQDEVAEEKNGHATFQDDEKAEACQEEQKTSEGQDEDQNSDLLYQDGSQDGSEDDPSHESPLKQHVAAQNGRAHPSPEQIKMRVLEEEIADLQASLREALGKNTILADMMANCRCGKASSIAGSASGSHKSSEDGDVTNGHGSYELDECYSRLDEATRVIQQLRLDNEEHKREVVRMKATLNQSMQQHRGGPRGRGRGGNRRMHHQDSIPSSSREQFPPLMQAVGHQIGQPRPQSHQPMPHPQQGPPRGQPKGRHHHHHNNNQRRYQPVEQANGSEELPAVRGYHRGQQWRWGGGRRGRGGGNRGAGRGEGQRRE